MGRPHAGRGSNQYQSKPGGQPRTSRSGLSAVQRALDDDTLVDADDEMVDEWMDDRGWSSLDVDNGDRVAWEGNGFAPEDAAEWINVGISDPNTADQWRSAGFDPEAAAEWTQITSISSASAAAGWARNGWKPAEADAWAQAGFEPYEAGGWEGVNADAPTAAAWRDAGWDPDDAAAHLATGVELAST